MATVVSVNVGRAAANPWKDGLRTGIGKTPHDGAVEIRDPGASGSGIAGDFIGDGKHHGGREQAVYAFCREDLDAWDGRLGREIPNGFFGENLTTRGLAVNDARLGEVWRVGADLELTVRSPRVPCATFRGWVDEPGWLKTFTADARPGAYLEVRRPGAVRAGDPIEIVHRPEHDVTIALTFRAVMDERELLPRIWAAGDDLTPGMANWLRQIQ